MMCPSCESFESKIADSRPDEEKNIVKRRRECIDCGFRWNTYEIDPDNIEESYLDRLLKRVVKI